MWSLFPSSIQLFLNSAFCFLLLDFWMGARHETEDIRPDSRSNWIELLRTNTGTSLESVYSTLERVLLRKWNSLHSLIADAEFISHSRYFILFYFILFSSILNTRPELFQRFFIIIISMSSQVKENYRKLPLACELVWLPITLFCSSLHLICSPLGIEPSVSCLITGGFFGMVVIPIAFFSLLIYVLAVSQVITPELVWLGAYWIGGPFCIYYCIAILILDKAHVEVEQSNPRQSRNRMERASETFLQSFLDYFPMTCVPWDSHAKLPPDRQYVFAVHAHGIHCTPLALFSTPGSDFDKKFPGLVGQKLTGLAATVMFKLPVVRELFLNMGYVDASRSVAAKTLEHNRSIYVCTGGEEESMYTTMGRDIVVLKKRKGFVRLALSYGADIVPVFGVGNTDLYKVSVWIMRWFSGAWFGSFLTNHFFCCYFSTRHTHSWPGFD